MRYKILLTLKLGITMINGILDIIQAAWRGLTRSKSGPPQVISESVTLKFTDGGVIAMGSTAPDVSEEEEKATQEFIEQLLSGGPGLEFRITEEHQTVAMEPSPAFTILAIEEKSRRIHLETLYPNVAEDRLSDFGPIHRTTFEGRQGVDVNGIPRDFVFYKLCLNIAPNFAFDRALERAVGLEHMDIKDAYENSVRLLEKDDVINNRDYTNELYSKLEIAGVQQGHMLMITTGLQDFPLWIDNDVVRIVLNEAASSDGFLRRYRIQINPEVSINFAASYCYEILKKLAKEVVVQGETWDIWRNET